MKSITFQALTSCVLFAMTMQAHAQSEATNGKQGEERNVMLNAADANKPREIQIGLPSEDVNVYENGLPAVYSSSVHKLSAHWRNDASLGQTGLLSPSESAITTGNIAYAVTAFTDLGQNAFHGKLNYHVNHFGMQNFDLNFSGGIGKNWLYNAGTYQNFDPGSFKLQFTDYADRTQIYHAGLTRILNGGKGYVSVQYKHANSKNPGNFANAAPFVYVGDGSIKKVNGFDPGLDSYVPASGAFTYRDIMTGEKKTWNLNKGSENRSHEVAFLANYRWDNGLLWKFDAKYMYVPVANFVDFGGSTISNVTAADGYTLDENGQDAYEGLIEGRRTWLHFGKVTSGMFTTELNKLFGKHNVRLGLNEWYYHLNYHSSSLQWTGTVGAYPQVLYSMATDPSDPTLTPTRTQFFGFNELSPEYTKGSENKLALYLTDN